jgi:DNA-binding protein H-NS
MSSLKNLSANQLSKMLTETQAELKRRENIDKARKDIQAVLKKYKITIDDLDLGVSSKKSTSKKTAAKKSTEKKAATKKAGSKKRAAKTPRKNDQRAAVAAKYHNPATGDKWSGRGRAPVWVTSLCTAEAIDIEQFKADPRFRI